MTKMFTAVTFYAGNTITLIWLLLLGSSICLEEQDICNRKPLQTKTEPLAPDKRFSLDIIGVQDTYIPNQLYRVVLQSTDNQSAFVAFTIAATGDKIPNEKNPLRTIDLLPGHLQSVPNSSDSIDSDTCIETVTQANVSPKTRVEALWTAPPKGNKCVTIYAYVAIKKDVWYSSEGPLSKRICEDHRNSQDMKPRENTNCGVCEGARYQLEFVGTWSENTHQGMYPKNRELARFSDIVGASHNKNFILYKDNSAATEGLQNLAEQGNTTGLEQEILRHLGKNVRTVIKARGPATPLDSTVASFRTSPRHHFISLALAIIPSPDWFLGVYNMELCDVKTNNWAEKVVLNLYPMDAGTDSGLTFEAPNEKTSPPKVISKAFVNYDQMKPFAVITVTLIRTYAADPEDPNCEPTEQTTYLQPDRGSDGGDGDGYEEPDNNRDRVRVPPEPITNPPVIEDHGIEDCPGTTAWGEWQPCDGPCEDNKISGYRMRLRDFVVNGVEVGKEEQTIEIPQECIDNIPTSETEKCEEPCGEETSESSDAQIGSWKEWTNWISTDAKP